MFDANASTKLEAKLSVVYWDFWLYLVGCVIEIKVPSKKCYVNIYSISNKYTYLDCTHKRPAIKSNNIRKRYKDVESIFHLMYVLDKIGSYFMLGSQIKIPNKHPIIWTFYIYSYLYGKR